MTIYNIISIFMINLSQLIGFDWDDGNMEKNWEKHKVNFKECEEIFNDSLLLVLPDNLHSQKEDRYHALGRINNNRFLFISLTIRKNKIRIISARGMNKKERKIYGQQ